MSADTVVAGDRSSGIRCFHQGTERTLTTAELVSALRSGSVWADIDSNDPAQHAALETVFAFHPLAIEDTLDPRTRVKIEEYDGYLFMVLRAMRFDPDAPLAGSQPQAKRLCLFLGRNYVVSVHAGPLASVTQAAEKLRHCSGMLEDEGPGRVAHLIGDALVDAYLPILREVDDFVDKLQHYDLAECDQSTLNDTFKVRRLAFAAHRSLTPQREIFDVLAHRPNALLSPDVQLYFRDVYDHALRITETLDAYRDLMSETTDSYVAQASMRLGNATKTFSAVATVVIPLVVISALFGMNLKAIPLAVAPGGFWILFCVQAAVSLAILAFLRWRGLV
jgi:magnesium transporter